MFSINTRGGKAFAADQKIWEIKKILLKSKRTEKRPGKRLKPNKLIKKATNNLSKTRSAKYRLSPNQIKEKKWKMIISQTYTTVIG